jgi:lysophospholipase L1-like esterase
MVTHSSSPGAEENRRRARFGLIGIALAALAAPGAAAETRCDLPMDSIALSGALPELARRFASETKITVVAIGSSSTEGAGASSKARCYPAQLDAQMDKRFPGVDFVVLNKGIGGQLAEDMLARFDEDVLAHKPALVLWQTGVNDAIRDVGVAKFKRLLRAGIDRIHKSGADVILVDLQYYPKSDRVSGYKDYNLAMHEVARETDTPIFGRYAAMKALIKAGRYSAEEMLYRDGFHMNDLSYGCLARLLSVAIAEKLAPGPAPAIVKQ